MAAGEVHLLDVGTTFIVTVYDMGTVVDISDAGTLDIILRSPSGTSTTYAAMLTTDGTDGKMQYQTDGSEFSAAGRWQIQAHVAWAAGGDWRSDITEFTVYSNL